jgi:DNA-binding FadR family transcriptional regulator
LIIRTDCGISHSSDASGGDVPIQSVEVQRLYQQIADQIGNLISAGEFRAGDRLPPERELAKQLGVSRPVVREAMIALEIAGLVDVRGGAGTFVKRACAEAASGLAAGSDQGAGPFDLIAARSLLEGEIAFSAAAHATDADIRGLAEAIEQMRADIAAGRDTRPSDRLFHVRVAGLTGNTVLSGLVDGLWTQMLAPMFDVLGRHAGLRGKDHMTIADHERILAALAQRDAAAARAAMRDHLAHVEQILMREDLEDTDAS